MYTVVLFSSTVSCSFSLISSENLEHCILFGSAKDLTEVESWRVSEPCEEWFKVLGYPLEEMGIWDRPWISSDEIWMT